MSQTNSSAANSPVDVETQRKIAAFSYVVPFLFLLPLLKKEHELSHYHAKQVLGLVAAAIALSLAAYVLAFIPIALISRIFSLAFSLGCLAMIVIGFRNAWASQCKPLPLIGVHAERVFRNL